MRCSALIMSGLLLLSGCDRHPVSKTLASSPATAATKTSPDDDQVFITTTNPDARRGLAHSVVDEGHQPWRLEPVWVARVELGTVLTEHYVSAVSKSVFEEAHLVDGHRHRVYVGFLRRPTARGPEPFWIQQFRRTPPHGEATLCRRRGGTGTQIASEPREPKVR